MKVSIASYAFHGLLAEGKMDVFGYLESCRHRYGLQAADIWNGFLKSTDEDYLKKVRQALDERDMVLVNLCVDGAHLWDPDPQVREKLYQNALAHLRAGEILGAKTVRIDMGGKSSEMTGEQFDHIVKRYREYCRRAGDNGYRVGPENHFGPALVLENMERVCKAVDHPAYGVLLHLTHWVQGEVDKGDRLCAPWTMHTHVQLGFTNEQLKEKMRMLLAAGYQGHWGVEHHSGKSEYIEVAHQVAQAAMLEHQLSMEGAPK